MVTETETLTLTLHHNIFTYLDYVFSANFIYIYIYIIFFCLGIDLPRATGVLGGDLPGSRVISTTFHSLSTPADRHNQLTHLTTLFGVFSTTIFRSIPLCPHQEVS